MNQSETNSIDTPVIIIGAGRSGTNMLRDLLVKVPGFATWPCDEINYIWRHGNRDYSTDEFTRLMADEKTARYIRRQFGIFASKNPNNTIVEKTCANSLRCGFIHEIFPHAKFIHIIRDGRDVAASAALRWNASLDVGYILKKARFVPWTDLPYYALRYLKARLYKLTSGKSRLSTWGPKFEGMEDAFTKYELLVGCALQWQRCVKLARTQLDDLPADQVLTIDYESFTSKPQNEFQKVCDFVQADTSGIDLEEFTSGVSDRSVGKWKSQLSDSQVDEIRELVGPLLEELGYS